MPSRCCWGSFWFSWIQFWNWDIRIRIINYWIFMITRNLRDTNTTILICLIRLWIYAFKWLASYLFLELIILIAVFWLTRRRDSCLKMCLKIWNRMRFFYYRLGKFIFVTFITPVIKKSRTFSGLIILLFNYLLVYIVIHSWRNVWNADFLLIILMMLICFAPVKKILNLCFPF